MFTLGGEWLALFSYTRTNPPFESNDELPSATKKITSLVPGGTEVCSVIGYSSNSRIYLQGLTRECHEGATGHAR